MTSPVLTTARPTLRQTGPRDAEGNVAVMACPRAGSAGRLRPRPRGWRAFAATQGHRAIRCPADHPAVEVWRHQARPAPYRRTA